jgi:two-component system response regulator AtoC
MATVLAIDDEACVREVMTDLLQAQGHEVLTADSAESGLDVLRWRRADVVLTDINMPGMGGVALLKRLASDRPELPRIAVSGAMSGRDRDAYLSAGAHAVLAKPFSFRELAEAIAARLSAQGPAGLVATSAQMARVVSLLRRVARSTTTVIIEGESGVGKELVARAIHELSDRAGKPFVAVHCGALSPTLLESELFGHVRGAFTDAVRDRTGCFERADGGTLFLDEVATMSPDTQVRLLRVLQEREVIRVGESSPRAVNVRVVCATNENLENLVTDGGFRQDLYYRLSVFKIEVPPLRERKADLLPLVRTFLDEMTGGSAPSLSVDAEAALVRHAWPGNVRELHNVIERALVLADAARELRPEHFELERAPALAKGAPVVSLPAEGLSLPALVDRIERELIEQSLGRVGGSRAEAARLLGLKRTTLVQKIKRSGIGSVAAAYA